MFKNILPALFSVLFVLITLEAAVRIFYLAPHAANISIEGYVFSDNPRLTYVHRPNAVLEEGTRINRDGHLRPDVVCIRIKV